MEEQLKFGLMLSLKEMALRRVAVLLSNDNKIRYSCCYFDNKWKIWRNTHEDKVKYKMSRLMIPETLRKEMIDKVRPISLEMRKYVEYMFHIPSIHEICVEKIYWTTAGTIDYKKSAESFLDGKVFDVRQRYELACRHCLEDYIPPLWEELPEHWKKRYLSNISDYPCLAYWPRILKGEFSELNCLWTTSDRNLTSFNQWAFEDAGGKGNKTAAEYFFLKMTHKEREASVMRTTLSVLSYSPIWCHSKSRYDALCYLLSLMTPEQQVEIIKEHPVHFFSYFFMLPWQDLLVQNIGLIWRFFPTSDYFELSTAILMILKLEYCYPKSFRQFFIMSPLDFKKHFVRPNSRTYSFLKHFFDNEDSDLMECIFRNLNAADRRALVFQFDVLYLFCRNVQKKGRRLMVKVCLREAQLSKEDRERLKKKRPLLRSVIKELNESNAIARVRTLLENSLRTP